MLTSLVAPILTSSSVIQQLLTDLSVAKMLTWKSFVLIYDESIGREDIKKVISKLSKFGTMTVLNLGPPEKVTKNGIKMIFDGARAFELGQKFISIVSKNVANDLFDEVSFDNVQNKHTQWNLHIVATAYNGHPLIMAT